MRNECAVERRTFLKGAVVASAAALGASLATGCAPKGQEEGGPASVQASAEGQSDVTWDHEADLVVIGGGTGVFGAIEALHNGKSVIVVEKAPAIGGTTILSGNTFWVPLNHKLGTGDLPKDCTEEEVFQYVDGADAFSASTDEEKRDYIANARKVFQQVEQDWGYPMVAGVGAGDYYNNLPFAAKVNERCMRFADPDDGSVVEGKVQWEKVLIPEIEKGATILTNTEAKRLVQDGNGRVIGVICESGGKQVSVGANTAVLMAAGGFDANEDMCRRFLRAPIEFSYAVPTNTGDGQRMGMAIGADLSCMAETHGGQAFCKDGEPFEWSWCAYGTYSVLLNERGKRFTNEGAPYGSMKESFAAYDFHENKAPNLRSYLLFTQQCVDLLGMWPNYAMERPEWAKEYDSFAAFAKDFGLDATAVEAEMARYNGFCETGVDEDFARGGQYELRNTVPDESLPNPCLGPVNPPFFAVEMANASLGTRGGLRVNSDSQVLHVDGSVIEGLYACGTCAGSPLGGAYPGGGSAVGPGFYQSYRAVNHMFDLGKI